MTWNTLFTPLDTTPATPLPALVITHLASWAAISVTGADQKTYLQGQLTCDVNALSAGQSTLGAHCDPKGKMWSIFRLFHHHAGLALFQRADALDTALQELKKYAVFSQTEITRSADIALGVIGEHADAFIGSLSEQTGDVRAVSGGTAVRISPLRWLLLLSEESTEAIISRTQNAIFADESLWDYYDIQEGIPRITAVNQNEYIPQALNLERLDGICFTKGCYSGQETVARAKYRGVNKRAMYQVCGHSDTKLEEVTELERQVGDNWRSAGQLIVHYRHSTGECCGLIVLPNDLETDTALRIKEQPDSQWRIETLPYLSEE
ncbi:tRNA-modifying protein YgfZ [Vibrio sp. HA2012]|uniref:tRNA-modifying protein YgfZ n=1 Tax=Vibrio sp. HA2012 TaxID=1971595 RepID=UPI000C2C83F7|nr:tRNA-modifying protein YgfZ [Vibrio sp. HA2012]PJC86275.1 tRNA-modifying protein YgfZ [Vibrio sp. HA2012]